MKQFMSLIAIVVVSSGAFAGVQSSTNAESAAAIGSAWKHQAPVSAGNHNLMMVGGQDISSRPMLEGPTLAA